MRFLIHVGKIDFIYSAKIFFLMVLILGGSQNMTSASQINLTSHDISSNPSIINGKKISSGDLDDLIFKDTVIHDVVFEGIDFTNLSATNITFRNVVFDTTKIFDSKFINVVFENCIFLNSKLQNNIFSMVHFLGGKMTYKGRYEYLSSQTYIRFSSFENVLFEKIDLNHVTMSEITGSVFLRNLYNVRDQEHGGLISGKTLNVIIDNVSATCALVKAEDGSIYAANSNLSNSGLETRQGIVVVDKCTFSGDIFGDTIAVTNSKGVMHFWGGGEGKKWYISSTELLREPNLLSVFRAAKGTQIFIEGTNVPAHIAIDGAMYRIRNQQIGTLTIYRTDLERLDLHNVSIKQGDWDLSIISSGDWENVTILGDIPVDGSTFTNIRAHNLKFPNGLPWKGTAEQISITETAKPFTWEPVKIPTAEELGVVYPWPAITGAGKAN